MKHWYVYVIIAIVAELLYSVCGKYKIIKSKPLRTFIVIFASSIICWFSYDFFITPE